ncbi:sulfite exporter TauE/SafE family protein [Aeromicrobium phragmitis]|uniref:Probable membrane transporter protein n=1 Tax=Aeromicrobium phragmitis TaxID=2478914 RepID=A0A3L8PMN2_9ACTN|nr:sulfite exporter TauE/SafE family protein [Aeromicrobium phragmitis]RLV56023.1 sulfite exporter TauE/SafE family protein [Aeromicrobium phragmitis]
MTPLDQLITVLAGLGAGIATSSIGVASLVSFPILLALGVPPVAANSSNTVALVPAGLTGALGYRRELIGRLPLAIAVMTLSGAAAVAGALLLLRLPPDVFAALVPYLILFACLLVAVQPRISAWLKSRRPEGTVTARTSMTPSLAGGTAACGVYGGYFGAGQGVMMIAVLSLALDLPLPVVSALRTLAVLASNIVATVIFVFIAPLDWHIVALLASGSIVGGYLGALVGRKLPTSVFRGLIVVAGVLVALGYWL